MIALPIAVYGATGHTGRFVLAELRRRGWPAVAIGRDAHALASLPPGLAIEYRVAPLDDAAALQRALRGCAAVIHCAGPFLDTAAPLLEAALRERVHYLDVTAEQASARATLDRSRYAAREARIAVLPAAAFFGGLGDLLVAATLGGLDNADEAAIAMALDNWHPTAGTRATGRRNTVPRQSIRGGRLEQMELLGAAARWDFSAPFGEQDVVELPFTEAILVAHHQRIGELRTWLNTLPLVQLRDPATPPPEPAGPDGRSAQRFRMECTVRRGAAMRHAAVSGQDIYAASAVLVTALATKVIANAPRGALAPSQAVDAAAFLSSLAPWITFEEPRFIESSPFSDA